MSATSPGHGALDAIRIVLVEPKHSGNIGAVARAMKTMSLASLYLVRPFDHPSHEAVRRAVGAADTLEGAVVVDRVEDAIGDCRLVVGCTARARSYPHPVLDARECSRKLVRDVARGDQVAVLFGPERTGLSNRDLHLCNFELRIPTNTAFASLNLASAVQLVCYEIFVASQEGVATSAPEIFYPSQSDMEYFYQHLVETLDSRGFLHPEKREASTAKLRRLFGRARPEVGELKLLHSLVRLMRRDGG